MTNSIRADTVAHHQSAVDSASDIPLLQPEKY